MQLWLQGPQSLEALGELAARFAAGLAAGEPPPPAAAAPGRVHCTAAGGLQPARAVALPADRFGDNVTLLREFLLDEAPGSLMASLRQRRLAGDVALNWLYQDRYSAGWRWSSPATGRKRSTGR